MSYKVIIPTRCLVNMIACLKAVTTHQPDAKVIVVDDDESGDVRGWLLNLQNQNIWRVEGEKPFIFSRNVNLGIKAAGTDDVILLNDDAMLMTNDGFGTLNRLSEENKNYGIISPTVDSVGNWNQSFSSQIGLRDEPRMLCFVCVYIPRHVLDKVGPLDERYVGYGCDDDDYSLEVRNAGFRLGIIQQVRMNHTTLTSQYRGHNKPGDFKPNLRRFIKKWGFDNRGMTRDNSPWKDLFDDEGTELHRDAQSEERGAVAGEGVEVNHPIV